MNDRGDELSTADLAGQSAGSGGGATVAGERALRGDGEQTADGRTVPSADHPADRAEVADPTPGAGGDLADTSARSDDADVPGDRPRPDFGDATSDVPGDRPAAGLGAATTGGGVGDRADYAGGTAGGTGGFADPTDRDAAVDRDDYTGGAADDRGRFADATAGRDAAVDRDDYTGGAPGDRGRFADATAGRDAAAYADAPGGGGAVVGDAAGPDVEGAGVAPGERAGGEAVGEMTPEPAGVTTGAGGVTTGAGADSGAGPLLPAPESEGYRARWTDVQTGFVDAPRRAVEQADSLVAELMQHLAKTFADERNQLESQWDRGDDVATDDLRTAFQRYRSFFERLLAT